jgi:hypothetical protein
VNIFVVSVALQLLLICPFCLYKPVLYVLVLRHFRYALTILDRLASIFGSEICMVLVVHVNTVLSIWTAKA